LEGLFYLIGPLRFKRLPKIQQIVILIPELPADYLTHWIQIGIFPEVYVIEVKHFLVNEHLPDINFLLGLADDSTRSQTRWN
jgi:hypothetical protein